MRSSDLPQASSQNLPVAAALKLAASYLDLLFAATFAANLETNNTLRPGND